MRTPFAVPLLRDSDQWEEWVNVTVKIYVRHVCEYEDKVDGTNACEVSSTKITKCSDKANSFPLPPRRKVIT